MDDIIKQKIRNLFPYDILEESYKRNFNEGLPYKEDDMKEDVVTKITKRAKTIYRTTSLTKEDSVRKAIDEVSSIEELSHTYRLFNITLNELIESIANKL